MMKGNRKGSKKNDPELIEIDENRDEKVTMSRIENDRIEFPTSGGPVECAKDKYVKGILYIELGDSCGDLCWSNRIGKKSIYLLDEFTEFTFPQDDYVD
jgi:hypothetical protein